MSSPKESWQSWDVVKVIGSSGETVILYNFNIILYHNII